MARSFHLQTSEHSTILDVTVWVRELDSHFLEHFYLELGERNSLV